MRLFDLGAGQENREVHDRVLTVPNAVTALRLAGLPVFVWLVVGAQALAGALVLLVVIAATDWVDGFAARRLDQVSRLGVVLDPLVDRLLLATAGITLVWAGIVPWWIVAAYVVRDAAVLAAAFALFGPVPKLAVTRTGKSATALLMLGVPLFLLAELVDMAQLRTVAMTVSTIGLLAYYGAAAQYGRAAARLRREQKGGASKHQGKR